MICRRDFYGIESFLGRMFGRHLQHVEEKISDMLHRFENYKFVELASCWVGKRESIYIPKAFIRPQQLKKRKNELAHTLREQES